MPAHPRRPGAPVGAGTPTGAPLQYHPGAPAGGSANVAAQAGAAAYAERAGLPGYALDQRHGAAPVGPALHREARSIPACPPEVAALARQDRLQRWPGWDHPIPSAQPIDVASSRFAPVVIPFGERWVPIITYTVPRGCVAIITAWAATWDTSKPAGPPYSFGLIVDSRPVAITDGATTAPIPLGAVTDPDQIPPNLLTPVWALAGGEQRVSVVILAAVPYAETPIARMMGYIVPRDAIADQDTDPCHAAATD